VSSQEDFQEEFIKNENAESDQIESGSTEKMATLYSSAAPLIQTATNGAIYAA
jgi:hypothetical protein